MAVGDDGRVGLRAVPVTGDRLADWAVSHAARVALENAAVALAGHPHRDAFELRPHASGLTLSANSVQLLGSLHAEAGHGSITVAADAAGVVTASIAFGVRAPPGPVTLTLNGLRDFAIRPLIQAVVSMLESAEALGRTLLELRFGRLEPAIAIDDAGARRDVPTNLPIGGELSLPIDSDYAEVMALAERWRADVGRAAGYATLLP
jgi:hypothetical protein